MCFGPDKGVMPGDCTARRKHKTGSSVPRNHLVTMAIVSDVSASH